MPRKSVAALSVVPAPHGHKRPEPPDELTAEEAVEWSVVVNRLPADWFPDESHQLLVQYCRHVVRARDIAGLLRRFDLEWTETLEGLQRYDKLTAMGEREGRAISSLATRMRLSQQSRYQKATAATRTAMKTDPPWTQVPSKPWDRTA
jgi:hypothetical protein